MRLALVFPGQGSQYVGMGKDLYEKSFRTQKLFQRAGDLLGYDLAEKCFAGTEEELKKTSVTQPAILTTSIALYNEFKESNKVSVVMMAGHSLGEYSALVAAESILFDDAVKLVAKRGTLMEKAVPQGEGGMAAVLGLERELTEKACQAALDDGIVEIANYNCPGQIVISGTNKGLHKAMENCKRAGAKRVIPLSVAGPFHSSLMKPAEELLGQELAGIRIKSPSVPFVANVSAGFVTEAEEIRRSLTKQVSHSVLWEDSVNRMVAEGIDTFVEIGPGKVLTGLIRKISPEVRLFNIQDTITLENTLAKMEEVI